MRGRAVSHIIPPKIKRNSRVHFFGVVSRNLRPVVTLSTVCGRDRHDQPCERSNPHTLKKKNRSTGRWHFNQLESNVLYQSTSYVKWPCDNSYALPGKIIIGWALVFNTFTKVYNPEMCATLQGLLLVLTITTFIFLHIFSFTAFLFKLSFKGAFIKY